MRVFGANEKGVTLTKQTKIGPCEQVGELANRRLESNLGSWVVNRSPSTEKDTAQASDVGSMLRSESLQQLSEPTYRGFFAPSFWTVLDPIETPISK